MTSKAELRRRFRKARRSLSRTTQRSASDAVLRALERSGLFWRLERKTGWLAAYAANVHRAGELDAWPVLARAWRYGQRTVLPAVSNSANGTQPALRWLPVTPSTPLQRSGLGLLEPAPQRSAIDPLSLSVLCLPLVAFDATGGRLGQGGGFYDRLLARYRSRGLPGPLRLGLAHDCQFSADTLPRDPWDEPLDAVVTPSGVQPFTARGARLIR